MKQVLKRRIVSPGMGPDGRVFCTIEISRGEKGLVLSITGVIGPLPNGDAKGGCGQIVNRLSESITAFSPGWDADKLGKFTKLWERWHLNDMRAGCSHQRDNWPDPSAQVELVSYKLTHEALQLRRETLSRASRAALAGEVFTPTRTGRALAEMSDWYADRHAPPDADSPLSGCYEVSKRESKAIGWIRPEEHPDGLLGKPCEECGYKYGHAWLYEDLPQEVLDFLAYLPSAEVPMPGQWKESAI